MGGGGRGARIQPLAVLGGSNAFWEIQELVNDINQAGERYEIAVVLDDDQNSWGRDLGGVSVSGPLERAGELGEDIRFVFGIGSYRTRLIRRDILERIGLSDDRFETLVHPTAKIFSTASLGHGCIIHVGTAVFSGARIESFAIISALSVIATNNLVGRGALIGSGVITADQASIGCYAHVGQGVLVAERCEVGPGAQIGMGGVVMQDVRPGAFGLGNPLRFLDRIDVPAEIQKEWEKSKVAFQPKKRQGG
jgi:UDP-3-O-[3-hydroxymyristoyl] glucosamine N-acyltransferase